MATRPTGKRNEVAQGSAGDWYWRHLAANGEETSRSSEGYKSSAHAVGQVVAGHHEVPTYIERGGEWSLVAAAVADGVTVQALDDAIQAEVDAAWRTAGGSIGDGTWRMDADGIGDTFCPELAQRVAARLGIGGTLS